MSYNTQGSGLNADTLDGPPKYKFIPSLQVNGKYTVLIADFNFWINNQIELENWLFANTEAGVETQEGMTLNFETEEERTWFLLRWK